VASLARPSEHRTSARGLCTLFVGLIRVDGGLHETRGPDLLTVFEKLEMERIVRVRIQGILAGVTLDERKLLL
jgi:hypothetical protein